MKKPKPATVGEREAMKHFRCRLDHTRAKGCGANLLARRIDAVVKREVKKALKARGK